MYTVQQGGNWFLQVGETFETEPLNKTIFPVVKQVKFFILDCSYIHTCKSSKCDPLLPEYEAE